MDQLEDTQPLISPSESEHDNMNSPEPTSSTGKRQTRSLSKWYLITPAGFSPRDWQTVKETYNTLDKVEQRKEFNNQADELVKKNFQKKI